MIIIYFICVIYLIGSIVGAIVNAIKGVPYEPPKSEPRPRWMDNPQTPGEVSQYIDYWGLDVYEGGYGEHKK